MKPRVDKQECATPDLSCTICRYPRPRRNFLLTSPFFRETRTLPQSSVRARAGHRPCSVKPRQVHEGHLSKRLAARASSKRLRQQKIPPWANPSASCTLLFIYSWWNVEKSRREQVSGLESTASRVLAPDFYAEMGFSTLWHTQRKCVRICWVWINCMQKTAKYGRGNSQYTFHVTSLGET